MSESSVPELIQFQRSHYNEKVRWALDYKRVKHTRRSLLPGPHAGVVKKITGDTQVPVLMLDGEAHAGSAYIIDELERRYPEPRLYPVDPGEKEQALNIQREFDEDIGPAVRTAFFSACVQAPSYLCSVFADHRSAPVQLGYRAMFSLVKPKVAASMGLGDPEHVRRCFVTTQKALDFVADRVGENGYLVGGRFSVADLAAASLLAPAVNPNHPQMLRPEPQPAPLQEWHNRWAGHPGTAWVQSVYDRNRPDSV